MNKILRLGAASSILFALAFTGLATSTKHNRSSVLHELNQPLASTAFVSRAQGLSVSVPIAPMEIPTVVVGHGFALTGAGAYFAYPPSTRSCTPTFSLIQTIIATGTTDRLPGVQGTSGKLGIGLFGYFPPVETDGHPIARHAKVWVHLLTETPEPVLVFAGGPWCTSLRPTGSPLPTMPLEPKTPTVETMRRWQQKMLAEGWHLVVDSQSHWRADDHGRPVFQEGAVAMVSLPIHTPLVIVNANLTSRPAPGFTTPTFITTTEIEINGVTKPPLLTLTGIYGYGTSAP